MWGIQCFYIEKDIKQKDGQKSRKIVKLTRYTIVQASANIIGAQMGSQREGQMWGWSPNRGLIIDTVKRGNIKEGV